MADWVTVMKYRVYLVDAGGRIAHLPQTLDAADDDAAIQQTMQYIGECHVEIWDRDRLVARIDRGGVKRTP
jgi:hypothetical protein